MPIINTPTHYGWVNIFLHWLIAVGVLALYGSGLWIEDMEYGDSLYQLVPHLHKSFGVLVVGLMLFRLLWSKINPRPLPLDNHKAWEKKLSRIAYWLLYALVIASFPTGYFIVTAKGQGMDVFNWFHIPALFSSAETLGDIGHELHEILADGLLVVAALHALAALKHHYIDKDVTLKRMLGKD